MPLLLLLYSRVCFFCLIIIPKSQLQYANGTVDPGLMGTWNIDRPQKKFLKPPAAPGPKGFMYGVMVVCPRRPRDGWQEPLESFCKQLEEDSNRVNVPLTRGGVPMGCTDDRAKMTDILKKMSNGGARIVVVPMMADDIYGAIKLAADSIGVLTQCIKWKNVERPPRGFQMNVMLKVAAKLGGTNHCLQSRATGTVRSQFQSPPASLSWVMDEPCMLVGVDVSHPESGSDTPSLAAVVGSMDGSAWQYAAHISAQTGRVEMVDALEDAFDGLLKSFKARNNRMPRRIVVFRDGVSDAQFEQVLGNELVKIKNALALHGDVDSIKISIVICQKGHHTRLFYEDSEGTVHNPCPGLVVDASGGNQSITNSVINEFYLNSHAAIQGTCKPCKYSLIHDEIGFTLSELELLTYWTTYLYARCNKSVSYATPAYYAHWASKRAAALLQAGATFEELRHISATWSLLGGAGASRFGSSMYFI